MRSRALLIGLLAGAVAAGAYVWLGRGGGEDGAGGEPAAQPAGAALDAAARPAARRGRPLRASSSASDPGAGPAGADEEATVRDHRGQAPTHPRPPRRGEKATYVVQAPVIARLRAALRPEIKKCSDEFAQDASPGAQIQGSLEVTVRSGVLSVVDVSIQQHGVAESSGLLDCARKAFAAARIRADGHADVERHTLRFPFRVPLR